MSFLNMPLLRSLRGFILWFYKYVTPTVLGKSQFKVVHGFFSLNEQANRPEIDQVSLQYQHNFLC
jgi:hypothetical protein